MAAPARTSATTTPRRRRPLQTCASSMSGIIDTAYEKTGSLGHFTKHLTRFATSTIPFASTMQNLGQTMISLTDDHIMFLERVTETIFPPAGHVFDKIDELVYSVVQDLPDSPKKTESSSEKEVQEKIMLISSSSSSEFAKSPDITTKSENFEEVILGQSSMVSNNGFAESTEQEKNDEIQGQSTEQENNDETQGQSTELDEALGLEFVESLDKKTLDHEAIGGGQPMVVSDHHQEPPLYPTDEYITSSCAGNGDSFHDEFEHVEISSDEDENYKDNFIYVSKPQQVGISSDHRHVAAIASSSSSSKKKASRKKKAIGKGKDEHKILELLKAKWHMM